MKSKLNKTLVKRMEDMQFDSGYISPEGKLYECPYAAHEVFAEVFCMVYEYDLKNPSYELEKRGWIKISRNDFQFGCIPTQQQIDTIYEWCVANDGSFVHNGKVKSFNEFMDEVGCMERSV